MPLRDDLLAPIAGPNPAGAEIRDDPVYAALKDARREDDDAPQGDWQRPRKTADWPLVIRLSGEALATKSKDLEIAAWLTEALLRRDGYAGLTAGLTVLRELVDRYWETLYPPVDEDGNAEWRAGRLEWVGRLDVATKSVPLTPAGHSFLAYKEARAVGYEAECGGDSAKLEARAKAVAAGRLAPEEFDAAVDAAPKAWYKALAGDLEACRAALGALDEAGRAKFGDDYPSYARLQEALDDVGRVARQLLERKLAADPDPVDPAASGVGAGAPAPARAGGERPAAAPAASAPSPIGAPGAGAEPASREDAAARVAAAARYLRRADPTNPAPYLLLRGLRWGELRARGGAPDPRLLEAPPTPLRTNLKTLLLDGRWPELLEAAEGVMASPQGRGWLDLQRYTVTALEHLGREYEHAAAAVVGALRALLADVPQLPAMTLMDDTPTANPDTAAWLRGSVLAAGAGAAPSVALPAAPDAVGANGRARHGSAGEYTLADLRGMRPEKAVELLSRESTRETSERGRFLRQTQLAGVMVDAGLEGVATPILQDLVRQIDAHKLDEWEAGELVAQPLALLYRCLEKVDGSDGAKQELYLRICRLDPPRAIEVARR
jgi:type VI secretion system protein ImpA